MRTTHILLLIKFILALCSIVYELVLSQALSAFFENTVLRYSITIGLYMLCIGIGALLADTRFRKDALMVLIRTELCLTFLGGFALGWFFLMDALGLPRPLFLFMSHALIVAIGILTGFEAPLVIERIRADRKHPESVVFAFDYAGAFAGSLLFAFIFYPHTGLVATALFVGMLNALAGLILFLVYIFPNKTSSLEGLFYAGAQSLLLIVILVCLLHSRIIDQWLITSYILKG